MSKIVMSIKTDISLKKKAQKIAAEMGFPLGTLINAFLRQLVKDQSVSFSARQEVPNAFLEKELQESEEDIAANRNISPFFDNEDDMIQYLQEA